MEARYTSIKKEVLMNRKSSLRRFLKAMYLGCLIFFCAEIILRVSGQKPWDPKPANIRAEPENKWVIGHEKLGYVHAPGRRKMVINDLFSFTATNLDNGLRITHPLEGYTSLENKKEIWIFGCSFTYGIVNDHETFPWLLQEIMPDYEIINFGQEGYSTLQSLIQFEEAIKNRNIPGLIIVAYASFHDPRNSCLRSFRKTLVPVSHLGPLFYPYARFDRNGNLRRYMSEFVYKELPLTRHSAFISLLEEPFSKIEDFFIRSHDISKALIKEFYNLCKEHNVDFVVAGIVSDPLTKDMLEYCEDQGISNTNITVDLGAKENTNLPFDNHPNVNANKMYAQKIFSFLKKRK